jgi:hypothetical protein
LQPKPEPECQCNPRQRKPSEETDETFGGLFTDVPLEAYGCVRCDRCQKLIEPWRPCAPVVL